MSPERRSHALPSIAIIEPVGGHGGMEYYDISLCRALHRLGVSASLFTTDKTQIPSDLEHVAATPYRNIYGQEAPVVRGLRYARASMSSLIEARRTGATVAHFHFFQIGPRELLDVVTARALGLSVVVTAHDVWSFARSIGGTPLASTTYSLAHRIIVHSEIAGRELQSLGIPASRIHRVPLGNYVDFLPRNRLTTEEARQRRGIEHSGRIIGFFGQIKTVKGLDILIDAFAEIARSHPDTNLLVVGRPWKADVSQLKARIEQLGLSGRVMTRLEYVPEAEVPEYIWSADLIVLPYRRIYQSGVLLLSMSCGRPIVASDIEGMREIITDGDNGFLFPSENPRMLAKRLKQVLDDSESARLVGMRGFEYVQTRHSWSLVAQRTAEAYAAVAAPN